MQVTVFMNEAGVVLLENAQGDLLTECFFKTDDETENELRHMGCQRLISAYPAAQITVDKGIAPEDIGELFLES